MLGALLILIGFYAIDITTPGKLTQLVRAGSPNAAAVVAAAGMVSMAFIVVLAIHSSSGNLSEGLVAPRCTG